MADAAPILTVTLNPALDRAADVPRVTAGPKLRVTAPEIDPGGGGINVSRAIARLGGHSRAFVALGGTVGAQMRALMETREAMDIDVFDLPGETRDSLTVTETETGAQFRFVLPGPIWPEGLADAAIDRIRDAVTSAGFVVLSGSQPPGVPVDFPARLAAALAPTGAQFVLDTSGPVLDDILRRAASLAILRMNRGEAEGLAGHPLPDLAATARFARDLVHRGAAAMVVVARGADGALLATRDEIVSTSAPKVVINSKVGAGDSFVAGLTLALARGARPDEALRRGMAAASATVMSPATHLCDAGDAARLYTDCIATRLDCETLRPVTGG